MELLKLGSSSSIVLLIIAIIFLSLNQCSTELSSCNNNQHSSRSSSSCEKPVSTSETTTDRYAQNQQQPQQPQPTSPTKTESSSSNSMENNNNNCYQQHRSTDVATQTISTYDFDCEKLNFCDDRPGFEAILYLHRQLDEDANGDIDITESDEFIRDELKYENGAERQKAFHGNDKHISVDELWQAWLKSAVHNWTVEETVEWLTETVELPKYQDKFIAHEINGMTLPRLAAYPQTFSQLGINNPIHKQKIALKAMDVVLFGVPKLKSTNKDLIMGFLFVFATVVGWYAYYQHKYSKEHIRKMMKEIEALSSAEQQLETLQQELEKTKQLNEETFKENRNLEQKLKQHSNGYDLIAATDLDGMNRIKELEEELNNTKGELRRVEQAYQSRQWIPSRALQPYLQLTYEIETRYYNGKKAAAELQLQAAREGCEKLKRKRSSIFGAFRMAHSSNIDFVDNTIIQARTLLSELTKEMQERIKRWKQIESYCCFDIIHNPGLVYLEQQLYGGPVSSPSTTSLSKLLRRGSDATLAEEDSMSIISAAPSNYSTFNNNKPAVQAFQIWHNYSNSNIQKPPTNLPIKKLSTASAYGSPVVSPNNSEDNFTDGGFYIGDQPTTNNILNSQNINNNGIRMNVVSNAKKRGSSDGVEKHFEELSLNKKHSGSQNSCCSQSESNIFDNTSICSAYYNNNQQQKLITNPNKFNAIQTELNNDNNCINNNAVGHDIDNDTNVSSLSINNNYSQQQQQLLKKELLLETTTTPTNEETESLSSNDSTLTINNSVASGDLTNNKGNKSNKKRGFFAIRKRTSKP